MVISTCNLKGAIVDSVTGIMYRAISRRGANVESLKLLGAEGGQNTALIYIGT